MDYHVKLGQKVFVHCHAGTGRTAIIMASYLLFSDRANSAEEAIAICRRDRKGTFPRANARDFVDVFTINLRT